MLQFDPKARPSAAQLCESSLFTYYAGKLNELAIVDEEFGKTIEGEKKASTKLLRTIYVPVDLKQLNGFLPKHNYAPDDTRTL
jgi:hypothetical protein